MIVVMITLLNTQKSELGEGENSQKGRGNKNTNKKFPILVLEFSKMSELLIPLRTHPKKKNNKLS